MPKYLEIQPNNPLQMPILENLDVFVDVDSVSRDVVTLGLKLVTSRIESDVHHHRRAQCIMALSGLLTCEAEEGIMIIPPGTALWIPPGVQHRTMFSGKVEGYNAFIEPAVARDLPVKCCSLVASPLLRELLVRTAGYPMDLADGGMESRVASLLIEEISISKVGQLHLPMPGDPRLRAIFQNIMESPADRRTMKDWAKHAAMSERTFARLVVAETGMSFGRWRQQISVVLALRWMAQGSSIQQVADGLGYENVGSFVTMFRKAMGKPPGRYMATQLM